MEVRNGRNRRPKIKINGYSELRENPVFTGELGGTQKWAMVPSWCIVRIMDCNSVKEVTNLPYKSTKIALKLADGSEIPCDGMLCGHDAHNYLRSPLLKFMARIKIFGKGTGSSIGTASRNLFWVQKLWWKMVLYPPMASRSQIFFLDAPRCHCHSMVAAASGVRMGRTESAWCNSSRKKWTWIYS